MCTDSDELNLLSCAFAKRIFSEENKSSSRRIRTIARISDRTLLDPEVGAGPLPKWSKADHIVCAGEEIVSRLASGLVAPAFEEAIPVHEGAYILVAEAEEGNPLVGSTVKEVRETFSSLPPIIATQTNGQPAKLEVDSHEICENDRIAFAITDLDQFRIVSSALGVPLEPIPQEPRALDPSPWLRALGPRPLSPTLRSPALVPGPLFLDAALALGAKADLGCRALVPWRALVPEPWDVGGGLLDADP